MKKMRTIHAVIGIVICWIIAISPYFVSALNVPTKVLGLPLTVLIGFIVVVLALLVNELAVRFIWDDYDENAEESTKQEGDGK